MKTREVARADSLPAIGDSEIWIGKPDSFLILTNRRLFVECEVIGEGLLG